MQVKRRSLVGFAASSMVTRSLLGAGVPSAGVAQVREEQRVTRVAAIQFEPKLGDVDANLGRAEALAREAIAKGAKFIVLPEFFPTGTAFHPSLYASYQPVDGRAAILLKELAQTGRVYVCGSFMAISGGEAYNTQILVTPDGTAFTHDKDFPTMAFESSFYAGGEDAVYAEQLAAAGARTDSARIRPRAESSPDGAVSHDKLGIGMALCWEIVRHRTAKRLVGKIDLLLASSAWWTADPDGDWPGLGRDQARATWTEHQSLIDTAPRRLARMLGAPVIHANFTGPNVGYTSAAFDRAAPGRYLGRSQIVDAEGKTLARFETEQGVLLADINSVRRQASDAISNDFWIPEVSESMRRRWTASGASGRDHYLRHTRTKLKG